MNNSETGLYKHSSGIRLNLCGWNAEQNRTPTPFLKPSGRNLVLLLKDRRTKGEEGRERRRCGILVFVFILRHETWDKCFWFGSNGKRREEKALTSTARFLLLAPDVIAVDSHLIPAGKLHSITFVVHLHPLSSSSTVITRARIKRDKSFGSRNYERGLLFSTLSSMDLISRQAQKILNALQFIIIIFV